MVLTYDQESELEILKHGNRMALEKLKHTNKMAEFEKEIEYANIIGGEINESDRSNENRICNDESR